MGTGLDVYGRILEITLERSRSVVGNETSVTSSKCLAWSRKDLGRYHRQAQDRVGESGESFWYPRWRTWFEDVLVCTNQTCVDGMGEELTLGGYIWLVAAIVLSWIFTGSVLIRYRTEPWYAQLVPLHALLRRLAWFVAISRLDSYTDAPLIMSIQLMRTIQTQHPRRCLKQKQRMSMKRGIF